MWSVGGEPDKPGHRDRPAGSRRRRVAVAGAGSAPSRRRPSRRPAARWPRRSPTRQLNASSGSRAILATEQMAFSIGTQTVLCRPVSTWSCRTNSTQTAVADDERERGERRVAQEAELLRPQRLPEQEDPRPRHRGGRAQRVRAGHQTAGGRSGLGQEPHQPVAQPEGGDVGQQRQHRDQGRADADRRGRQPAGGQHPEEPDRAATSRRCRRSTRTRCGASAPAGDPTRRKRPASWRRSRPRTPLGGRPRWTLERAQT